VAKRLGESFWGDFFRLCLAVPRAMKVSFVNLFRRPVTVHYPDKTRNYPDRYRGLLALTYDKETGEENCIGCRLCEYICPPQVIKVEMLKAEKRNFAKVFTLELYACEFCELCVQVCPTDAIIMMKSFDMSTADRRELVGHRQPAARHADAAQGGQGGGDRGGRAPRREGRGRRRVSLEALAFWGLAAVLLASSLAVVLTRNLFHSVLYLALSLTATAGLFLSLDAEFLAAIQLLLYAGGVVTIAVFAIVVTERLVGDRITQTSRQILTGFILSGALLVALLVVFRRGPLTVPRPAVSGDLTRAIGQSLITTYVLPFELLGVLLLAALVGALYFARPDD
jgi:NADH-quinone oxidoreductase subunit J